MKIINKKISLVAIALVVLLTSCLKDHDYEDGLSGVKPDKNARIAEISGPVSGFRVADLIARNADTTLSTLITVRLASDEAPKSDVRILLAVDNGLVTTYNTQNGTHYTPLPANLYSVPDLSVLIPAGQRVGYLRLVTKPSNLLTAEYALGFKIVEASNSDIRISGNFSKQVVAFAVRNKYDGAYNVSVKTVGWAAFGIASGVSYNWGGKLHLVTASATSVTLLDPSNGSNLQVAFTSAGGGTLFGAAAPLYTFDAATDKLTAVTNTLPDDGRGRTFRINASDPNNKYDEATKKIFASYYMTQAGRPDQEIYMTFTYVGSR